MFLIITEQDTGRSVNDVKARDLLGARQNEFLQKRPNQLYFQTHAILKIRAGNTIDW